MRKFMLVTLGASYLISYPYMSSCGWPLTTQCANSRPHPPASMIPEELKPHPWKNPRSSGASPISGLWSAVKDSGPHTVDFTPVSAITGTRLHAPSIWALNTSQSRSKRENANLSLTWGKTAKKYMGTSVSKLHVIIIIEDVDSV